MKALCIHAHFDDFEFVLGGTFELWRRQLGSKFQGRVIVCTDGQAGHHFRTRAETGRIRLQEQEASAKIGGYEFAPLRLPDGRFPREACLQVTEDFLAALWKAIRDFQPDYLFCPPLPMDPLAGVHVDHVAVAEAVRKVAYMINVPHAFTPEYPADETKSTPCKVPVIINLYDPYMHGANAIDLAIDIETAFETVARMTYCHQSQISEWLPWVGRHDMQTPRSLEEWTTVLRRRYRRQNAELELATDHAVEVFRVTAWGEIPDLQQLRADFPAWLREPSPEFQSRLRRWKGE